MAPLATMVFLGMVSPLFCLFGREGSCKRKCHRFLAMQVGERLGDGVCKENDVGGFGGPMHMQVLADERSGKIEEEDERSFEESTSSDDLLSE